MSRPRSTAAAAALVAVALAGASACSSDTSTVSGQARQGDGKGYVAGDGTIEQLDPSQRGAAVDLSGKTLEGSPWSLADQRGKVVVVNVWGSWCAPCVEETPLLAQVAKAQAGKPVTFVGVDYRESAETGLAFQRKQGVPYPSLADDGGAAIVALQGKATTTPTTLVIDKQGRIAARISGPVQARTLTDLLADAVTEAG